MGILRRCIVCHVQGTDCSESNGVTLLRYWRIRFHTLLSCPTASKAFTCRVNPQIISISSRFRFRYEWRVTSYVTGYGWSRGVGQTNFGPIAGRSPFIHVERGRKRSKISFVKCCRPGPPSIITLCHIYYMWLRLDPRSL